MILSVLTRHRCFPIPHMLRAPSPRPQLNRAQARDPPARDRKEHPQGAAPVGDPVAQPRRAAEPWVGSLRRAPVRNAQRVGGRCETADEGVCVCVRPEGGFWGAGSSDFHTTWSLWGGACGRGARAQRVLSRLSCRMRHASVRMRGCVSGATGKVPQPAATPKSPRF